MFGNKSAQTTSLPHSAHIGQNIRITGQIDSPEQVFLAGELEGDISCDQLTIDATGRVTGKITAKTAIINGRVDGDVVVEKLHVQSRAILKGTLSYQTIQVDEGAQIDGNFVQLAAELPRDVVALPNADR